MVLAAPAYLLACTFTVGGLASSEYPGDVRHYRDFARQIIGGLVPYDDFTVEYPPVALVVFLAPALADDAGYVTLFKALMAACGLGTLAVVTAILVRREACDRDLVAGVALVSLSPLLLGYLYLNRFDAFAALLAVSALALLLEGRERVGTAALAVAFAAKIFVGAALPAVGVRLWRTAGRAALVRGAATFAAVSLLLFGPWFAVAFGGFGFSFFLHVTRLLHTESLGGSLVLLLDRIGLYEASIVADLSVDLEGTLPQAVATASSAILLVALGAVAYVYLRGPEDVIRFTVAVAASVTAFVIFAKVLSPQFLIWLIPFVALVPGRRGRLAMALLAVAGVLSHAVQYAIDGLVVTDTGVALLLARNALLIALLLLLVRDLSLRSEAPVVGLRSRSGA